MTNKDLTDFLETAIDDSFDLGWTSRDAAKLIVSRMNQEGLVLAPSQPAADLVEALRTLLAEARERGGGVSNGERLGCAALSRYAKGGA